MIENLVMIEGAYFYNYIKTISKSAIKNVFREISNNKLGNYVANNVKEEIIISGKKITYSLCIFKYEQRPTFLKHVIDRELKYAYALVVEYDDYVIISKKNVSGLEKLLKNKISVLDYKIISKLFVDDDTKFEKMTMNNMDISDNVIRRTNVEALNLKDSYSTLSASRSIINNMRIKESDERYTLSLNTSRINKISRKSDFTGFCEWVINVVDKIIAFVDEDSYLDHFAQPLDFQSNIGLLEPNNVLLLVSDLKNEGYVEKIYYKSADRTRELSLDKVVDLLETAKPIRKITRGKKTQYYIENNLDSTLRLKINMKSITLHSNKLSNIIIVTNDGLEESLLSYLNKKHEYIICFEDIDTVYKNKKIFKDSQLLGNLDQFMEVFVEHSELSTITSEKGKLETTSTMFDSDCLFGFVEEKLAIGDEYVICDDLGNEWADHISVNPYKSINYYHSKHSKLTSGASSFHEVVSQAQKNIGNFFVGKKELERKASKWSGEYKNKNVQSKIKRIRKGNLSDFNDVFIKTSTTPNTSKRVYLVVNFISKSNLLSEINVLKNGTGRPKNETIQLLWLLSSLITSCQSANVDVYITCQP